MPDSTVRLVRCPKCENLLPELADYSLYQCGACGAVLRAKHQVYVTATAGLSEGDSANLIHPIPIPIPTHTSSSVKSNIHPSRLMCATQNQSESEEKGVLENNNHNDEQQQDKAKSQIHQENLSKFSRNGEKMMMEQGFPRRNPPADMETVRYSTSDEGPSNAAYSAFPNNHMEESWKNLLHKQQTHDDGAKRVQHLQKDRAELLRKLNQLKDQLGKSSEMVNNNPKEKGLPHGYVASDPWFPSGLNRRTLISGQQFFGPDKHMPDGPPHFSYHQDPYPCYITTAANHETAMHPNFHPSMHNSNQYGGDPFASQMLRRRGAHHQFPQQQQPLRPYFPERYVNANPDSYAHNPLLHTPSCSCFHCYDNKQRASVPLPPASFINSRFPDIPNDPMLYQHHEFPGAFGSHVPNSRTSIPPLPFRENQLHAARWPSDFNSDLGGFVRTRTRKPMVASSSQRCRPVAGGSPFITCYNCFELLQLPKRALILVKNHQQKVRCGACSSEISFDVINKKLVISPHSEMKAVLTRVDDRSNEVLSSHVSHTRGHANRSGANFSSDDYSGYDFLSLDKEPLSVVGLSSNKSQEMNSFHSSSASTSEDENSPEVMITPREAIKSIHQPTKDSLSPPAGSPLQEYFDHSNNNHAVNRFGKGNRSSRSEQEKAKSEKITTRQNSLKEAAVATEMDVRDYSNTGISQESRDTSREYDHTRSNKGGESFFANIIKKSFRDFSRSNQTVDRGKNNVTVNGQPLSDRMIKKAEKQAGSIQPGNYWYDFRAGFWGIIGGPCLGIIPPFIEEFNHPLPDKCSGGNTGVFVNGRELHQKDLDLLAGRGLPPDRDRSYIIEISGRVLDEDTGEELDSLGKLAPTVEKVKHGFGMKPRAVQ